MGNAGGTTAHEEVKESGVERSVSAEPSPEEPQEKKNLFSCHEFKLVRQARSRRT